MRQLAGSSSSNRQSLYFAVSVSLLFLATTLSSSVSACRLGICKGQVNFLTQKRFARVAEYAIYTVDVPCALGSACLQFSVNSAFNHGVYRTAPLHYLCAYNVFGQRHLAPVTLATKATPHAAYTGRVASRMPHACPRPTKKSKH